VEGAPDDEDELVAEEEDGGLRPPAMRVEIKSHTKGHGWEYDSSHYSTKVII